MDDFFKQLNDIFKERTGRRKILLKSSTEFYNKRINNKKTKITSDYSRDRMTGEKSGVNCKKYKNDSPDLVNDLSTLIDKEY